MRGKDVQPEVDLDGAAKTSSSPVPRSFPFPFPSLDDNEESSPAPPNDLPLAPTSCASTDSAQAFAPSVAVFFASLPSLKISLIFYPSSHKISLSVLKIPAVATTNGAGLEDDLGDFGEPAVVELDLIAFFKSKGITEGLTASRVTFDSVRQERRGSVEARWGERGRQAAD